MPRGASDSERWRPLVDAVLERKPCRYAYTGGLAISALSSLASADLTVADGLAGVGEFGGLFSRCGAGFRITVPRLRLYSGCVRLCDGMRES